MYVCACMYACMYVFMCVCMYDVDEMTCEKTRNLQPNLLLLVAVFQITDIRIFNNQANTKLIVAYVLPKLTKLNAAKTV